MAQGVEKARTRQGLVHASRAYVRTFAQLKPNARRLLLANVCINVGVGVFGVLFNLYLVALGYGLVFIGVVAAVSTISQAMVAPTVGWSMRRFGARGTMRAGAGTMALGYALSAVATSGTALALASALAGIGYSVATIPTAPYMMEHATAEERTHLFSAYFASNTVGSMIGSLLSGLVPGAVAVLLVSRHAIVVTDRAGLLVGAAITALAVWLFWLMRDEARGAGGQERMVLPVEEAVPEERLRRDVLVMLAATGVIAWSMGATIPFFNVYFSSHLHASTAAIGTIYALSGVVCTVAAFAAPALARWGRLHGFSAARTLTAPAFLIFWLHPGLGVAAAAYISRNALGTISGALENTFAMEILPARLRGTVASWRSFTFNGGWTIGSLVAGVVVAHFGYDVVFVASGLITIAGSIAYFTRFQSLKAVGSRQ